MQGEETAKVLMDGSKNYYSFLRPHMGLENEAPTERVNLVLELGIWPWLFAVYPIKR